MSVYSVDSLEDNNEVSPRNTDSLRENIARYTESNETTPSAGTDKDTRTAGSRNAIIANGELVDASKRRRPTSSRPGKRDVTDRLKRNNTNSSNQENDSGNKRIVTRCSKRFPKTFSTKRSYCPMDSPMPMRPDKKLGNVLAPKIQPARKPRSYLELYRRRFSGPQYNVRSPEGSTLSVCGDSEREQLSDDDTGSLATPRDDQSELSFYRRIIEGSTDPLAPVTRSIETVHLRELQDTNISSTCSNGAKQDQSGDKSKKGLGYRPYTIEEYKTLPIPKLDRSLGPDKVEMQAKKSVYPLKLRHKYLKTFPRKKYSRHPRLVASRQRRMLSKSRQQCCSSETAFWLACRRSSGSRATPGVQRGNSCRRHTRRHSKFQKPLSREWLMRRRSYGNSVSARNRQRILLLQAHRHKSRDGIAEKCFLPPLKDQEVDAKTQSNSLRSTISDDQETIEKSSNMNSDRCFKKNHNIRKISSSRRSKKFERTSSFCSSLNSYDIIEDSYLESLRQRHLYEKEMVDRIINQALCP
ncbi:hypothetical protein ANTRET_LOCUS3238, partial [Anthophora retusa]